MKCEATRREGGGGATISSYSHLVGGTSQEAKVFYNESVFTGGDKSFPLFSFSVGKYF